MSPHGATRNHFERRWLREVGAPTAGRCYRGDRSSHHPKRYQLKTRSDFGALMCSI